MFSLPISGIFTDSYDKIKPRIDSKGATICLGTCTWYQP